MKPIQPCGGNSYNESFVTKMAQTILENQSTQSEIKTSNVQTKEYSLPVDKIAGLTEILGEGKYIKPEDKNKAFQQILP